MSNIFTRLKKVKDPVIVAYAIEGIVTHNMHKETVTEKEINMLFDEFIDCQADPERIEWLEWRKLTLLQLINKEA